MSPRPRSGVSHLSDSGGRRVAVRKLLTHGRHRPCIQVLGALLQVPAVSVAAHTPVGTHACGHTGPCSAQEAVAEAAPLSIHCQFPAPGWWSDQYICRGSENVCSRVNVQVVCFSLNSMLSEISQEGNTGRRFSAPPHTHFPFLFI